MVRNWWFVAGLGAVAPPRGYARGRLAARGVPDILRLLRGKTRRYTFLVCLYDDHEPIAEADALDLQIMLQGRQFVLERQPRVGL